MARVIRIAKGCAVIGWETCAAMTRTKPFSVSLLGASSRAANFTTATEAERFAVGMMEEDDGLFGAVVRHGDEPGAVSRVLPG